MSTLSIPQALQVALSHHQAGRLAEAEGIYRQVLGHDPNNFDALHLLGVLAMGVGRNDAAAELIARAIAMNGAVADAHANLGSACRALGRYEQAIQACQNAVRLNPQSGQALQCLAICLVEVDRLEEAVGVWRQLIAMRPQAADAHSNLGVTLERLGRLEEALVACRRAVEIDPSYAPGHVNLGSVQTKLGQVEAAVASLGTAIRLRPDFGPAYYNLSFACMQLGTLDEAVAAARKAIELMPDDSGSYRNLAAALQEHGLLEESAQAYEKTVRLLEANPQLRDRPQTRELIARMRLAAAVMLPAVYESVDEIERWRAKLVTSLQQLADEGIRLHLDGEPAPTLFALAYQGRDDREIQRDFARLMVAPEAPPAVHSGSARRIKVGFISRFFKMHTIGQLNRGLVAQLNRDEFEVTVLSVGDYHDAVADFLREKADHYVMLSSALGAARQAIADEKPDILFYTDTGMDPVTYSLACSRLAPVQCTTWGHPVTSGIEAMDYFISSEVLDPAGNEAQYTEELVRLKSLAVYYYRPEAPPSARTRQDFGLPTDAHLYGCLQMLWKFHPEFDAILAGVLRADPLGRILLIQGLSPHWDARLRERFARTMPDVAERIVFLRRQDRDGFLALTTLCDVMLDPIHFGGGNTSYEAFAFGVPTVTMPSKFLRGRITLAQYRMMGIEDCIVKKAEEYVEVGAGLGMDLDRRNIVREKILAANDVLYENRGAVKELEEFFKRAGAKVRGPSEATG